MSIRTCDPLTYSRRALLSLAVTAALALASHAARSSEAFAKSATPHRPSQTHPVMNCNSSGAGSLSAVLADPMTGNGDTVDLTGLKMVCSRITLGGPLIVNQDTLIIEGAGAKYLTIDGANNSRLFRHFGTGTLALSGLTLANGFYSGPLKPLGGCLDSTGNISLIDSEISHCTVKSTSANLALGGGVHVAGGLTLLRSTISDSHAEGTANGAAGGGGAFIEGDFTMLYSTIRDNTVAAVPGAAFGFGGGAEGAGNVDIEDSTISGNHADVDGALVISGAAQSATIINSTISSNVGSAEYGGIWTNTSLTLRNSTVAFNRSPAGGAGKGDGLYSRMAAPLLVSTIIAGNSGKDGPNDLGGLDMQNTSHSNLIVASQTMLPVDTIRNCPKLDVLADNGGTTLTHGLNVTSGAIDHGSAAMSLTVDQRLAPRVTGPQADIGAVERQQGDLPERILASGFDGLCDQ